MRKVLLLASMAALLATGGIALAQQSPPQPEEPAAQPTEPELQEPDRQFLYDAVQANEAAIQMAMLARERVEEGPVHEFAQRLLDDHMKLRDRLKDTVMKIGAEMPGAPDAEHREKVRALVINSDADFAPTYVLATIDGQSELLELFRREAEQGMHPWLRDLAKDAQPMLEEHLRLAEGLASRGGSQG
jgi:putative membrane protein